VRIALTTCPPDDATRLADVLLEAGAACINVLPGVTSHYRWQGAIHRDAESLLIIKAAAERLPQLHEALRRHHGYELPEWVVLETDSLLTDPAYRRWVRGA